MYGKSLIHELKFEQPNEYRVLCPDGFYRPYIDNGIVELIRNLTISGFKTIACCSGLPEDHEKENEYDIEGNEWYLWYLSLDIDDFLKIKDKVTKLIKRYESEYISTEIIQRNDKSVASIYFNVTLDRIIRPILRSPEQGEIFCESVKSFMENFNKIIL